MRNWLFLPKRLSLFSHRTLSTFTLPIFVCGNGRERVVDESGSVFGRAAFLVRRDRKRDLSGPKENWFVRAGKCARIAQETERKENEKAILDVQLFAGAGACF